MGAITGLVARVVRQLGELTTGRLNVRVSTTGVDVDVGCNRRVSEISTAGAAITVGLQVCGGGWRECEWVGGMGTGAGLGGDDALGVCLCVCM